MCARPVSEVLPYYMVPWSEIEWPVRWSEYFQREAALNVEIGFGNGLFLLEQARRAPDVNFVGIELSWGCVQHLVARLDAAGLTHVRLIHGEAHASLQYLFASNSIQEIWINFPDPWPKKRHQARRLIQPELVALLSDRLTGNGRATIATDHQGYAAWIATLLEGQGDLTPCFPTTAVHELTGRRPTKYEQRARGENLPVYYFVWRKLAVSMPTTPPQGKPIMPHVILEGSGALEPTLNSWTPRTWSEGQHGVELSITLSRIYRELTDDSWLLELVVKEGKLVQHIGVTIAPRSQGQVLIKLSPLGFPRPTWGVQRAVWHVARMLQDSDASWRVIWMSMAMPGQEAAETVVRERRRRGAGDERTTTRRRL
jgi:tRNA (guanine-N7-)-methyltransferase